MRFNTQPPEGGCLVSLFSFLPALWFQHTATRRWLPGEISLNGNASKCFNTQPPEGGCPQKYILFAKALMFQHTATRRWLQLTRFACYLTVMFQHTATRRWLLFKRCHSCSACRVSTHSHPKVAATYFSTPSSKFHVSTHSHPKVAAKLFYRLTLIIICFNTQPPEGGCSLHKKARKISKLNTVFR